MERKTFYRGLNILMGVLTILAVMNYLEKQDNFTIGDLWFGEEVDTNTPNNRFGGVETYSIEEKQDMRDMILGIEPETHDAILSYSPLGPTDDHPNGGTLLVAGWDINRNGDIDSDEVTYEIPIWNGSDGLDGKNSSPYIGDDGYWYINEMRTDFPVTRVDEPLVKKSKREFKKKLK